MHSFYLDASALAKRYTIEPGPLLLDHLFANAVPDRLYVLNIGTAEVASLLVRKKNAGLISPASLTQALANVRAEIVFSSGLHRIVATNALVASAVALVELHSINATDAVVLRSALTVAAKLRTANVDLALVASDQRLLRAAQAEGLTTFDPETQTQPELDRLL